MTTVSRSGTHVMALWLLKLGHLNVAPIVVMITLTAISLTDDWSLHLPGQSDKFHAVCCMLNCVHGNQGNRVQQVMPSC